MVRVIVAMAVAAGFAQRCVLLGGNGALWPLGPSERMIRDAFAWPLQLEDALGEAGMGVQPSY